MFIDNLIGIHGALNNISCSFLMGRILGRVWVFWVACLFGAWTFGVEGSF